MSWKERINQLKHFHQLHGHCQVPKDNPDFEELSNWIRQLRHSYSRFQRGLEEKIALNQERIAELRSIGIHLSVTKSNRHWKRQDNVIWNLRMQELKDFKQIHGHFRVPSYREYRTLCYWVQDIQKEYLKYLQGWTCRLTDDQIKQLVEIGFELTKKRKQKLKDFREVRGDCRVPFKESGCKSRFTDTIKPMSQEAEWTQRLEELKQFQFKYGHSNVPNDTIEYKPLWDWIQSTRQEFKKRKRGEPSRLSDECIRQLKENSRERKRFSQKVAISEYHSTKDPASESSVTGFRTSVATVTPVRQHPQECGMWKGILVPSRDGRALDRAEKRVRFDYNTKQKSTTMVNHQHGSRLSRQLRLDKSQATAISPSTSTTRKRNHRRMLPTRGNVAPQTSLHRKVDPSVSRISYSVSDNATGTGDAMKPHQESHLDLVTADAKGPRPVAIPSFLQGLDDTVMAMMAEMNRVEREEEKSAANPNARMGKPNTFWLDIGDRDGIHF